MTRSRKSRSWQVIRMAPGVRPQEILEPLHAQQVEMVGGLVQQQQVMLERQQTAERQPHGPSARERGHRRIELGRPRNPGPAGSPSPVPPSHTRRPTRTPPSRRRTRPGAFGSPSSIALQHHLEPPIRLRPRPQVTQHRLEDRPLAQGVDFLRQIPDRALSIPEHLAAVQVIVPHQHLEQRRLAGAILSQQPHSLSTHDRRIHAVVKHLAAEILLGFDQSDHNSAGSSGRLRSRSEGQGTHAKE